MTTYQHLEKITEELMAIYEINTPPVPIESMLQSPLGNMWDEIDIGKLSSSFINVRDYYSPRMSLARLLARHIVTSPWGAERGMNSISKDENMLRAFARLLMMPTSMVMALTPSSRAPEHLSIHFEVPLEDAVQRLQDLGQ